ncbi:hypothetical protein [uncultured Brevundimonas sp.]|uniref:hypothetical protein n=1 Tax=uncultured Brevundimonas sp. TaxID=213418 RepID=UPI0030EE4476
MPASEYFETLTETAFSATPAQLDATIAQARAAVARDRRTLSPPVAALLDERLRQIADAREGLNRADLAIASIEAFRLVVSATSTAGGVPLEVSLLDYAGFRYGADLKAPVVRWDDAAQAADFAAEQWALISARVSDQALRSRFGAAVAAMAASARNRDAAGAALAGATELDLVDELETFFAHG